MSLKDIKCFLLRTLENRTTPYDKNECNCYRSKYVKHNCICEDAMLNIINIVLKIQKHYDILNEKTKLEINELELRIIEYYHLKVQYIDELMNLYNLILITSDKKQRELFKSIGHQE
jgi:hypothetical protein